MADNFRKGSEWRKWDLHVHTPASYCWQGGKRLVDMSVEEVNVSIKKFIQVINETDVATFCIMDYWTFDWCVLLKKYLLDNPDELTKIVLYGMELRVECPVNYRLNIHVILSDKLTKQQLEDFKSELRIRIGNNSKKLSNEALIGLAKSLGKDKAKVHGYENPESLSDDQLLELGNKTAEITKDSLFEAFKQIPPDMGYILLPYDTSDGLLKLDWSQHPQADNYFMQTAKIFESRDQRNIDLFNGVKTEENKLFFENFYKTLGNQPKPCVAGSDAHKFENYGVFPSGKATWIKADPSFEGLSQILWEPKDRVKIQERDPSDAKPSRIIIDHLLYKNPNGEEETVQLSKDLNSIIGVRGSGKSTLLKNMAYIVDKEQFEDKDRSDRMYELESFKVIWGDGQENGGTEDSPKNVFYIPQNYLSLLAYDEAGKSVERDIFLTNLLKKNIKFANAIRAYEDFVSDNRINIEGLIEELLKTNQIFRDAKVQIKKQGARKEIEAEIATKNEEIKKYQGTDKTLTEDEIKDYTNAKQSVVDNFKRITTLDQDKDILNELIKSGADVMNITSQEIARLSVERQLTLRNELLKKSKENLKQLINFEISEINKEIESLKTAITVKQEILDRLSEKIKANKALETLTKELGQLQQTLKTISELEITITRASENKETAITGLTNAYTAFDIQQNAIFGTIKFEEDFLFLRLDIITNYNTNDLKDFVFKNINTRDTDSTLKTDVEIQTLFGESPIKLSADVIRKVILNLIDEKIVVKKEVVDIAQVISQLLKNRYEVDFLNSVKTKQDGILFKNMTGGQKAIAMLELVFSFDDERYPILIDQPEDDLDVGGIATDLVNFVKLQKEKRQIIVVSHNGSLVVCSDTEDVIVSSSKKLDGKYQFSYITGAIENPVIRHQIIDVLEGGKDALKQRARKLNFRNEI